MRPALLLLAAYLLGAFPTSFVVARVRGIDLRQHGSGNLGATNAFRVLGWKAAAPVFIVDSNSSGMTLGFAALAAARIVQTGGDVQQARSVAERRGRDAHVLIYVDTLHYLRQTGRISAVAKLFGDALSVKPLLTVIDGEVTPFDKVVVSSSK